MSRQDIENAAPVRIALAESMARTLGFTQVIVFGHSQESGTVITTWGDTPERSAQAAAGANNIKKQWGWPEDTIAESAKVVALQERIKELEAQSPAPGAIGVYLVRRRTCEYGRAAEDGGFYAFLSPDSAKDYVTRRAEGDRDDGEVFTYLGFYPCSVKLLARVSASRLGRAHFHTLGDLLE